jgi:hypothetical protein
MAGWHPAKFGDNQGRMCGTSDEDYDYEEDYEHD